MKKVLFILVLLLSMLVLLTAGSVYAQTRMQVEVPFAFTVADKLFLADTYTAVRSNPLNLNIVQLRTKDLSDLIYFFTTSREARLNQEVKPKFVFRRYGDQYFLAQVWLGGGVGHEIGKSTTERHVAKLASEPEWIYIAAK